jgi:hypothetical protein
VKRLVLAALLIATPCSVLAARPIDPPRQHAGTWTVSYWVAAGPDSYRISAADYAERVRAGGCGPRSHVTLWPARAGRRAELQIICEDE